MKKKKANPDYVHKPGGDDLTEMPEDLKFLESYGVTAHKYGNFLYLRGAGYSSHILDEFLRKRNNNESVVIAVTGPPGTGKTYFGMMLAMILDPKFNITDTPAPDPDKDLGQVTFHRNHILYLTGPNSPLKRGQVVLPDETHFGVGSRTWNNKDQQSLTNYIAAIRSKGFILVFIVLHTTMLDKMVRDYVINYEIHVQKRGEGIVYRRWFPQFGKEIYKKRIGKLILPMPDAALCNYSSCLGCKSLDPKKEDNRCISIRAIYERRKLAFLDEQGKIHEEQEKEAKYHTIQEIVQGTILDTKLIVYKPSGRIHRAQTIANLREKGFRVKIREEPSIIARLQR